MPFQKDEQLDKPWHICTMENYTAIKRNKLLNYTKFDKKLDKVWQNYTLWIISAYC